MGSSAPSPEVAYWTSSRGQRHVTPAGGPEDRTALRWALHSVVPRAGGTLLDFGCGPGRLFPFLDAGAGAWVYCGVDVCAPFIAAARSAHPGADFRVIAADETLPAADVVLAYTVLLHVSDAALPGVLARLRDTKATSVWVGEILGRRWRRAGDPPVFNREREEYAEAFAKIGFYHAGTTPIPYRRYGGVTLDLLAFARVATR